MENNENITEFTKKDYLKILWKSLPFLGFFTLALVAVWLFEFVLTEYGYGLGIFGIVIVGLILVPLYFATQGCTYFVCRKKRGIPSSNFFKVFRAYFDPSVFGIYRVIRNLLLSILWGFLASIVFAAFYGFLAEALDPSLASAMETMANYLEAGDAEAVLNFMKESEDYVRFTNMVTFASSAVETMSFVIYMARSSAIMCLTESVISPRSSATIETYKYAHRKHLINGYNKDFFKGTWFLFIPIVIMYALGSFVGYYAFQGNDYQWLLMGNLGMGFSLILIPFILPYLFVFLFELVRKYEKGFLKSTVGLLKLSYNEMKQKHLFGDETQENRFKETIKLFEERANKDEEKKEEKNDKDDYGASDHH